MTKKNIVGTVNVVTALQIILDSVVRGVHPVIAFLREAAANAEDAQATSVQIEIDPVRKTFTVTDNGIGFDPHRIERFASLFKHLPEALRKRGGDKFSKNNSGRCAAFSFGEAIVVTSVSEEYPNGVNFNITRSDLETLFADRKLDMSHKVKELARRPDWWPIEGTGSVIEVKVSDWNDVPDAKKDIAPKLVQHLSFRQAKMLTLNGQPLPKRPMDGDPLEIVIPDHPKFGSVEVYLYLPKTGSSFDQGVQIGGYAPISSLRSFLEPSKKAELVSKIPAILYEIQGDILLGVLNDYRWHDSHTFDQGLYRKALFNDVVEFLIHELGPQVEKAFAIRQAEAERAQQQEFLDEFKDAVNPVFDYNRKDAPTVSGLLTGKTKGVGPGGDVPFWMTPRTVTLLPGHDQLFSVIRVLDSSGQYDVDEDGIGGTFTSKSDREFLYVAGKKPGTYNLHFFDRRSASKAVDCTVTILERKPGLSLSHSHIQLQQGKSKVVAIDCPQLHSHTSYKWVAKDFPRGLTLRAGKNGMEVRLVATPSCAIGTYTLVAHPDGKPTVKAECLVHVVEVPPDEHPLKIGDYYYKLELSRTRGSEQPYVVVKLNAERTAQGRVGLVRVSPEHDVLRAAQKLQGGKGKEYRSLILLDSVLQGHVAALVAEGLLHSVEALTEFDKLRTQILKSRAKIS